MRKWLIAGGIANAAIMPRLWRYSCIEKTVRIARAVRHEPQGCAVEAMETATIHQAIEASVGIGQAASSVSAMPGSRDSFANHFQRAMETGQDNTAELKPAGRDGGSVKQPTGMPGVPDVKDNRAVKPAAATGAPAAAPVLVASANGPVPTPATAAAPTGSAASTDDASATSHGTASMALSWLTAMLPDLLGTTPAKPGASISAADSSAKTASHAVASKTENQQAPNAEPASALSREAASAVNRPDPVRALTVPSTPGAPSAPDGRSSAASGAPNQREEAMQGVTQTAESAALSLLAKSTTAGAGVIPSVIDSVASATSRAATADGKASAAATATAHSPTPAPSQAPAKDTSAATSQTQTAAANAASQDVKAVNGIQADGKNSGSQGGQQKGSGSPAAPGASAAPQAGASASVANAAQAAVNGFPAALSQSTAAGNSQPHSSAPSQGGAPQPTTGEKIAVAMETPAGLPQTTVSAASLLHSQARSEMRVAVQTEGMGAVELHAVLASGKLGASISVVSHEAHTLLNNELPALQQVLTDQNLRIDHLSVINAPMSSGAGAGDSRGFQSGDYSRPQARDMRWYSAAAPVVRSAEDIAMPGSARRLSVRA